jgi:hypothetical protein
MTLSQTFDNLKTLFETQELKAILGPLSVALTNFAANPTAINGVAQLASLQAAVLAVQPGIIQAELQSLAATVAAAAQNAVTAVPKSS